MISEATNQGRKQQTRAPITLKLSPDLNCLLAPDISADDPVELIREHAFIQRFDMRAVSSRERRRRHDLTRRARRRLPDLSHVSVVAVTHSQCRFRTQ